MIMIIEIEKDSTKRFWIYEWIAVRNRSGVKPKVDLDNILDNENITYQLITAPCLR